MLHSESIWSATMDNYVDGIVHLLKSSEVRRRPVQILLNKVDRTDFDDQDTENFTNGVLEFKEIVVGKIRAKWGKDTVVSCRAVQVSGMSSNTPIVTAVEKLEDVVQLCSTHA